MKIEKKRGKDTFICIFMLEYGNRKYGEKHQRKEDRKQTANKSDMFQFHFFFCPFFVTRLRFFSVCSVVRFDCSKVCFFVVRSAL